jgi:anti-sigma regulatory factor (Ser/Thr protein kinase)
MQTKREAILRADPQAAGTARRWLDGLGSDVDGGLLDDLKLLVSELVTNSVRHAGVAPQDHIRLTIGVSADRVHVQVCDEGLGFMPHVVMPGVYASSGWGLFFVGQLASRWGVSRDTRTCVWFEVDRRSQTAKRMWSTSPSLTT